ncbi:MAG TPA: DNA-3-methyladenine glycosylase [Candidatus Lustribacter sp.]
MPKSRLASRHKVLRDALPIATVALAKALIGLTLVRRNAQGVTAGRIVEVEAYLHGDPAAHSFRGLTARNAALFGEPHRAYVYFIYGNHWCFNVTAETDGLPGGVLIRALEPLDGLDLMRARRGVEAVAELCRGPGRLCRAMGIDGRLNGRNLLAGREIYLGPAVAPAVRLGSSARVGIARARQRRLRFYESGSPFVSGPRSLSAL